MSELDQLYQAVIVDHDRAPRNHGPLASATHDATADNPLCGDIVTLQLRIADGIIRDISFESRGCALSRSAASILTTMLRDRSLASAHALAAFAGVRRFRSRRACATLPLRALAAAVAAPG